MQDPEETVGATDGYAEKSADPGVPEDRVDNRPLIDLVQDHRGIQRSDSSGPLVPPELSGRYPRLPAELVEFLQAMDSCVNADETVWFLCREDFRRY